MANPWEFNWQWDDLDPAPEAPKPVTTRQQLASKSARANDPWTMNWDWARAEASAGTQDFDRVSPMVTTGDLNAANYVANEEYQMPELLHEEQSQRNFVRPKGEMFHARSYVPGAVPEQRVITDRLSPWDMTWRAAARGLEDIAQTGYAMVGGDPRDIPTMPLTVMDNPMTVESAWDDPGLAAEQAASMIIRMWPMIAAGVGGAAAGASGAAGVAGTEILGSAAGAMAATFAQSMGPRFKQMLMQYPDDPERAWREAGNATLIDVGATGIGGLLIGAGPLGTSFKQAMFQTFGLRPMAELTGRQLAGNLAIQTLGIQPLVGVANMQAVDAYLGQDTGLTIGDEYLNNLAPGLVQTGAEIVGRQAMAPFAKKTAPGGTPTGSHFTDQIAEANDLEKLAADLRTSPEIAAQIPEGLKFQIDQGNDPFKDYRDPTLTLNASLKSKLSEVLNKMPEGTKLAGQQWYNTLKNAGVKDEELSDYGFDAMLSTNHEENRKKIWTREQLLGQFEANDYAIIREERGDGQTTYGPDEGYSELSTPDIEAYRENLFTLRNRESTPLNVYGAKRGIDVQSLRRDADNGHKDAEAAYNLLLAEHRAYLKFRKDNPAWSKKHAPGDDFPEDATHWGSAGNVLMHDRTGELVFNDGERSHHIDENQSDYIQANKDVATRDMPEAEANEISRFAHGDFERKLIDGDLRDMSFLDDSLLPGVELNGSKLDDLESVFTETNPSRPYSWVNGLREGLIRFAERPETFRQDERNRILKYVDPDKLSAQLPKMKDVSERAKAAINDVMEVRNLPRGPQNVPLKKSWSKAVFKAEVVKAINKGLKRLTWTSGDVQMKRNDVGQRLSEIQIEKTDNARYNIYARDLNGDVVLSRQGLFDEGVRAYLGMDLANRALKKIDSMPEDGVGNYATLGPDELKNDRLGGSFHEKLYDEKMVQWAKEIGKKYGKRPYQVTYTDSNGGQHKMWAMDLVPEMAENLYRYQVSDDADQKNLVAVRQMSADALRKAIELGGIPMPSVAIIDKRNGLSSLSSFSDDITLVAPKEMVDPSGGARVFDSDIFSPGTPASRYVVDPAARTKLSKELQKVADEVKAPSLTDDVIKKVGESGLIALSESHAVVVKFARDIGWLKKGETVMNSDGAGVTRLREWAQGHPDFRGWLNTNFGKLISTKKVLSRKRSDRTERLSPFTLESMLRIMESRPLKGANTNLDSAAYFRGLSAKELSSIDQIKSESGKLIPREKSEKLFKGLQGDFDRSIEYLSHRAAEWAGQEYDAPTHRAVAQRFLKEVLHSNGSAKRIGETFSKANATDIHDAKELIKRIDGTATSYFEAKVPGVVSFDRWAHVIARADRVSPEDIEALKKLGIGRIDLVRGDDETVAQMRDLIINGLGHLHFQADAAPTDKTVTQAAGDTRKVSLTKKQEKQFRNLIRNLISEVKRINPLADVRFLDRFIGFSEDGTAINVNGISHLLGIGIGLGNNRDPFGTARHEAGHTVMWLMDSLKAWKPGEREAFVEWYETVLSKKHADFLKNYAPEHRFEEAIVQELGVSRNKWKGYPQKIRNALYRIDGILRAIRTAFKRAFGRKMKPEDIAAMFDAGIMARRAIRKMRRLEGKTRGTSFARTPDGSLSYQITEESLRDTVFSSQLDNTLYGKIDNPAIGTKLKKGTGSQWRAELIKQGVKLEELQDSGLDEYLTENSSKPMTLQDVIDFREKNRIELHMVMLDDGTQSYVRKPDEEDPLSELKEKVSEEDKYFDSIRPENVLPFITGREPGTFGGINNFITSKVRGAVESKARDEIRSNPARYDDNPTDPRHTAYIYDAKDDVMGRLVVWKDDGKSLDLGWVDPLTMSWRTGFDKKRTPEHHKKMLDRQLQELLDTLQPIHIPETENSVEIHEDHRGDDATPDYRFYAEVFTQNGRHVETISGPTREIVKERFWEFVNRRKFNHRFEYKPYEGERYIPVNYTRGGHEALVQDKTNDLADLQRRVDLLNEQSEQQWVERNSNRVYYRLAKDGELLNKFAREAMLELVPEGRRDFARQHDDLLTASASFFLASAMFNPESLAVAYPSFDRFRWRAWKEATNNLADGIRSKSDTRYSSWSLPGGNFRREVLITAPDLQRADGESLHTHFGDYEDQNVVVHTRLAEFYTEDGSVMNFADENQSDAMQRASEAREDLIKTYGFKARPGLAFDKKGHQAEWADIRDEARATEKDRTRVYQNRRASYSMTYGLADSVMAAISSRELDEKSEATLAAFSERYLDKSPSSLPRYVSGMGHADRTGQFLRHLIANMEYHLNDQSDGKSMNGFYIIDRSIESAIYDTTGVDAYDKNNKKQIRDDVLKMLRGVEIPDVVMEEGTPKPPGVRTMHDAIFLMIGTWRGLSKSLRALSRYENIAFENPNLPNVRFAPKRTPHKRSWGLMAFKYALWDAVQRGHKWVGFTTGEQQNTRYASALRKGVERMRFDRNGDKATVNIKLVNGENKKLSNVPRHELARYIGRGAADQVFDHPDSSGELTGDNIMFNLPGVMDHYDKGLPKEIKPLLDQFGMKIVMKKIGQIVGNEFKPMHEVYGIEITPKAEQAVKKGELFRYQVSTDDLSGSLESQLDTVLMPDSPARTKLKKGTGAQWRAELTKQGVKLEELRDSGLDEYFTDNKDTQLTLDQVFQHRQGNRIDVIMKVLDDGTEPLVKRSKEVATREPDAPFDWEDKLGEYDGRAADKIKEKLDEAINEWINEDSDFDTTDNPRYPYEARERNEVTYELVEYNPDGTIEDYIDNYDDDYHFAQRQLRDRYGAGKKKYVADKPFRDDDDMWVVAIRDDWGDGEIVETIRAELEDDAISEADDYIDENSPYYGISEGETNDWGVYDTSEDRWEETGLTKREAERSAERSNDHHIDYWYEQANNEAWDILRGDPDKMFEMYEEAAERHFGRRDYEEIKETPGYEQAVRKYISDEWRIGDSGGTGKPRKADSTKFGNWVLRGGRYYREYVLAAPDMSNDGIDMRTHFGGVTRNVLGHFRANDFQTADGGVALVAQEFQSDVHQDASDVRQTLIKKVGFQPSPTLGYGDSFKGALQEKAAPLVETIDALERNLEQMQVTIANAFIKRIPEIIDIVGLGAFTRTGVPDPTTRDLIEPHLKQLLSRIVSDRPQHRSTTETIDNLVWSLYFFRSDVNVQTFSGKIIEALNKLPAASNVFPGAQNMHQELRFAAKQMKKLRKDFLKKREEANEIAGLRPAAPERLPFKQSWGLLEFKILLHEAIRNGYDYFAMTTGDQQVERYGNALKDAIRDIKYDINPDTDKADIVINLNGREPHKMSGVTETELARYVGKETASRVFNAEGKKGTLDASGVSFKSPGILNHYDRTIPSDTKKFLAALDMKWEPLDIGSVTRTVSPPAPKQEWRLIQRGTRSDGTVQEATVVRDTREAIELIMENANRLLNDRDRLLREHGFTDYSHELIEPTATNLPAPAETVKFNKAHTVHGVKISEKARMWIQGSPEQPTKRFLKYQVETPDHANDDARLGVKPSYQVEHHDTPEFKRFFGKSYATDDLKPGGKPIELYRGEHGKPDGRDIQNRLPSITLTDDASIANLYAEEPNDRRFDRAATAPRVGKYYARIEKPLFVEKDDPFAELGPLSKKLGISELMKVIDGSSRIESAIKNTSVWDEKYSDYGSVRELLSERPEAINDMYAQSNILLDNREFVDLAKSKGYDGAIHLGWSAAKDAIEYRVFDQSQLKSAIGNSGAYDPNDPRLTYQVETPDGLIPADPAVNTPRFKVWFKKSKIIDAVGHPLRVFHGSLKTFNAFNSSWGTNEGFFGRRFYFTNHPGDASDNYASRKGPDNQYKMNKFLDQNDTADEADYWSNMDNEGVVYPVYLSIQNPVVIGSSAETRFGYRDMLRLAQAAKHAEKLVSIFDGQGKLSDVITEIMMNETPGSGDYITAGEMIKRIREHEGIWEITDENGDNAYAEVLRQAFETLGYDGIVDYGVNSRWKWIKHQNVEHFIAFRPNQIKSVFNRGTWSSRMDDIHYQVASEDPVRSPQFRAWLGDALLRTADGEPLPVFHATGNDFDKFRRSRHDIGFHIGTVGQANERFAAKQKYAEQEGNDSFRPNVMKLYTNIRSPITLTDLGHWSIEYVFNQLKDKADSGAAGAPLTSEEVINFAMEYQEATGVWKENALFQLKKLLSSKGYDSIVYYNKFEIEGRHAAEEALASAKENHRSALQRMHPGRDPWNLSPTLAPAEWAAVLQAEHNLQEIRKKLVPSYAVFWPNQLKSVFNKGTWSSDKRSIMYQAKWEDAPQSSSFLDSLREGFSGQWENLDEEASLSSSEADLRKVYRKDWLDMRRGPNHFQFALMLRGRPIGRINGVINGDTARLNWIGIIGGDEGLGDGAVRHLGAMLRLKLPNEVRLLTGLRKGPEEAYAAEEQKAAQKPKPSGPSGTKVRTPGGSQEDPLIEYYRNLGRF